MKGSQEISKSISRTILLNPGPGTTSQTVKAAMIVEDTCPRESHFGDLMKDIGKGLLGIGKGTYTHEVAIFVASGTGAMEATLVSAIRPGQKVLIVTNGAYGLRMASICEAYGIDYSTIFTYGQYPDPKVVREKIRSGSFTHLAMIHHETSTGMMNPLEELSDVAKSENVRLIVDAMSSFGAYPIDLSETHIDYLFSSSNKCIQGMAGLSFVLFHKDRLDELKANSRATYFDVYKQWSGLLTTGQLRFTPPVQVCHAFLVAIQETLGETVEGRWARYQANWRILYEGFKALGFGFFLPEDQQSKILLAINLDSKPDFQFEQFHDYMHDQGITVYPGVIPEINTFRVAVIGDLDINDMHFVVEQSQKFFN